MKLTIDPKLLADTVAWAARAIPTRPSIPVLSGLLIAAHDDQLDVSAFDYDISVRGTIPADVAEPGLLLLPGRVLAEVAKALPDRAMLNLTATDAEAVLTCGRAEFALPTLPVEDYPTLPELPDTVGSIDADQFAAAVSQVAPAAGRDDTLPMLTGIRVDADGDQLTLAATDRYRIAARDLIWQPNGAPFGQLIPARQLQDIAKGLGHGTVQIGIGDGLTSFTSGNRHTTVRLLDDQFIDYRSRITHEAAINVSVDAAALATAVKRIAIVAERTTAVHLAFDREQVLVRAGAADVGRGNETVGCTLAGNPIQIAFQSQYLLDALNAIDGTARIGMDGTTKPALFRSDDDTYRCLVMSLRVS
ncbi:DNA polymerase III subunit beta [Nonomuraea rhodomycinica]|uniref:Beta sliding clamp n=1 Tax=Nonomuraea rhodomycinica TaxID=1712872 RepID=A0A7Y6IWE5_9ACTN|nr:DNA polymerase III subunit beta [Nonomuraea rhodomycinica]NUW45580.1 DNA polymerase III subunit beta [Nonomuraea rhodomycinica]